MRKRHFKRVMAMVLAFALVFTMNTGAFAVSDAGVSDPQSAAEGVQGQEKTEGAQVQTQVLAQAEVKEGASENEPAESGQASDPAETETQQRAPESEPAESAAEGEEAAGTETVSEESALAAGGVSEDSAGAEGDTEGADEPIVTDEGETEEAAGAAEKYVFDECNNVVKVPKSAAEDKQWIITRDGKYRDSERVEYQENSEGGLQYIRIYGGNITITCGKNAKPANLEIYPFPIPTDIKMGDGVAAVHNSSYEYYRDILYIKGKNIDSSSISLTLMHMESTSYDGVVLENVDNNNYVPAVRLKSGLTGDLFNQDGGKALNGYALDSSDGVEYGTKKDYYYYDKEDNKIYPTSITPWKEQNAPGTNDWGAYWDNNGNLYVSGNEAYEYVAKYYEDKPKRSVDVTGTLKEQEGGVYAVTNTSFRRSDSVYVYARRKSKVSGNDTYYTSAWSEVKKPEELPNYSYPFYFKYNKTIKLPVKAASDKQWTFTYNGTPGENEYVMLTDSGKANTLQKFDLNSENVTITGGINADPAELNTSAYTYIDGLAVAVGGGRLYSIYSDSRLDKDRSYTLMARKTTAAEGVLENVSGNETVPAISQNSNATGEIYKCSDGSKISNSTVLTAADNKHIKSGAQITGDYLYFDKANNMVSFASVRVWDTQQTPSVAKDDQLEAMYDMSQNNIMIFGSEGYEYKVQKSGSTAPKRSTSADGVLEKYVEGQYVAEYKLEGTVTGHDIYVRRAGSSAGFKYSSDWSAAITVAKPENVELAFNRASGGKISVTYPGKNGTLEDALSVTSTNSAGQGRVDVYVISENKIEEAEKILSGNKPGDYAMVSLNKLKENDPGVKYRTESGFLPGKYLAIANFIPDFHNVYSAKKFATAEVSVNKAEALTDVRFKENPAAAPGKSVKYIKAGTTLSYNDLTAFVYDSANGCEDTLKLSGNYVFVLEGPLDDQVITKDKPASINELYNGISYKVYVSSNGAELKEGDGKEKEDPKGFELTDGREGYTASLVVVKNPDLHLSMSKTGRELYYESAMGLYEDVYNEIMGKLLKFTFKYKGDDTELEPAFIELTYSTTGKNGPFKKISEIKEVSLNADNTIYVSANSPILGLTSVEPVSFEIRKSVIDIKLYNDAHEDYDFLSHKWGEVKEQTYSGSLYTTLANGERPVKSTPYGKLGGNGTYAFGTVLNGTKGTVKVDEVNKNEAGDYPVYLSSPVLKPALTDNYEISDNTVKGIWRVDAPYDKAFYFKEN
ncbi:MAG: hypothetical protein IJ805_00290, partial [Lachnospiraceae bacterium]|nr:hypothetical protein [Lachnospiraceae bacterium]